MIELQMVRRMALHALAIAPIVVAGLWIWGGSRYGISAIIGIGMTILNLFLSGLLIGKVADNKPELLMPTAIATFMLGLLVLTGIALLLRTTDTVYFPVTGFVLIGSHLLVVLWEAAGNHNKVQTPSGTPMKVRS
ncbi:MAG: hypothetical protein M3174_04160 [Actinomycetota bacterium]|nr:hypothetical protein [Actinomycetota bacterium]